MRSISGPGIAMQGPPPTDLGTRVPTDRLVLVPHMLLERKHELGLTSALLEVLLHLLSFRWTDTQEPYPKVKTLAKRMGVHPRTMREYLHDLEQLGLIEILYRYVPDEEVGDCRQTSNEYDLTPLFRVLGVADPVTPRDPAPMPSPAIPPLAGRPYQEEYKGNRNSRTQQRNQRSQAKNFLETSSKCPGCGAGHVPWTCRR